MDCHQILTGAVNAGDACFSCGSVEGIPFTTYAAGSNIVILASNFQRIQIIPGIIYGNVQVSCIDANTDVGKIAAAYGKKICIFEPTPIPGQNSPHRLDYKWIQTGALEADCPVTSLSWSLEGSKLLTGGTCIQLWQLVSLTSDEINTITAGSDGNPFLTSNQQNGEAQKAVPEHADLEDKVRWDCVWSCRTSCPVHLLKFSPDGNLFCSAGKADRLVKIWYESAAKTNYTSQSAPNFEGQPTIQPTIQPPMNEVNYSFIYLAHPRAVTGISWRKTSKYIPRGSVANMLVTSCRDNIARIWVQTLLPDDGLVNFTQLESLAKNTVPHFRTQRHRHKIMQRLKHMKSLAHFKKRQAVHEDEIQENTGAIASLPSTFSVHDFHSFAIQGTAVIPGLHFHLAASINAETDIPLVPSLSGNIDSNRVGPAFVMHWLNNKDMNFTHQAESLLQDISIKIFQSENRFKSGQQSDSASDTIDANAQEEGGIDGDAMNSATIGSGAKGIKKSKQQHHQHPHTSSSRTNRQKEEIVHSQDQENDSQPSRQSFHTEASSMSSSSLATEINAALGGHQSATTAPSPTSHSELGSILDRKLDAMQREWQSTADLLFSIHPVDGSLLVWLVEWLDESAPGTFRQAQVSFSSRIPNAIPLHDAAAMSTHLALYSPCSPLDLRAAHMAASQSVSSNLNQEAQSPTKQEPFEDETRKSEDVEIPKRTTTAQSFPTPIIYLITKHNNGSLNLWQLGFADNSNYTQVLSVSHCCRVCGHRFRVNDVRCHPVLPLCLTTSHHNLPGTDLLFPRSPGSSATSPTLETPPTSSCGPQPTSSNGLPNAGFCSELILWKVDPVGPLSKSGGVTELARINSAEISAFANVAWVPTLLPSATLGSISNSPSACFVASDGHQLRLYQAVIDARTLLAEIQAAERVQNGSGLQSHSISGASTPSAHEMTRQNLRDIFKVISLQSTARPGCILELEPISDAVHDWKNTQLLHVFQEQMIRGDYVYKEWNEKKGKNTHSLLEPSLGACVDLRNSEIFEEPFFLVVIEKNDSGQSVIHTWRLIISSHSSSDSDPHGLVYVPDTNLIQDPESDHSNTSSRSGSPDAGRRGSKAHQSKPLNLFPLKISTEKVCTQILPLPEDVEVIHASVAAGHLSSSVIYPACFAPYLICTASTDGCLRFWCCKSIDDIKSSQDSSQKAQGSRTPKFQWVEWEMLLSKEKSSVVKVPGTPLYVSCAYSGRVACAYKQGQSYTRPAGAQQGTKKYVNVSLAIFECESTGGSEWILEDTIHLKNVPLPSCESLSRGNIDIGHLVDTSIKNKKAVDTLVNRLGGVDDHVGDQRGTPNIQRLLSVPSYTTMQSLKKIISEQGNQVTLNQKSVVQLDWVSTEDGSHVLTVSVGSKISLFTPVSNDIAQANLQAMKASSKTVPTASNRVLLKQASSMASSLLGSDEIRWMTLRTSYLKTADGLPPLPMQLAWVRDGILIIGMDNEMHVYSQWKSSESEATPEVQESRILTEHGLLTVAQGTSHLRLPGPSLGRSPSSSHLAGSSGHTTDKTAKSQAGHDASPRSHDSHPNQQQAGQPPAAPLSTGSDGKEPLSAHHLPDFGIFEASRLACPVLPQYHPKQLMELLAFGKINRVRAILTHLVHTLTSVTEDKAPQQPSFDRSSDSDKSPRPWLRSRTLSVAAPPISPGALTSPVDQEGLPVLTEELQLDYAEITSVRPLPLATLIESEFEKSKPFEASPTRASSRAARADNLLHVGGEYDPLFDSTAKSQVEETLDEILGKNVFTFSPKLKKQAQEAKRSLTDFGPREARILGKLLTHSHLPGLSSLDQMHLLALADSVASFNPNAGKSNLSTTSADELSEGLEGASAVGTVEGQVSADSLDDCGLRFLLTMRQHIYLLRCLPLAQRKTLQKIGLGTHNIVWAFHSETQEELMQLIPSVKRGNPTWSELKDLGIGWWIRNNNILRKLFEKIAKAAFQAKQDPLDAALYYMAMKKKNLVWGLFRSVQDRKMTDFFQHNFQEEKWRKAALKNAYALLGKQRFEHAAAFFLLAGNLWDVVEVCLNKLDDLQLAMCIVRLYEGEIETVPATLKRLLYQEILGCKQDGNDYRSNKAHPDPFLRSMSYWMLQEYSLSLTTLLETDIGHAHPKASSDAFESKSGELAINPHVFNFYLYLRTHPLVVRRQMAQALIDMRDGMSKGVEASCSGDAITPFERRLFFLTAHAHFRAGCPSLALEVLSRLPQRIILSGDEAPMARRDSSARRLEQMKSIDIITGQIANGEIAPKPPAQSTSESFDWSQPTTVPEPTLDLDWGAPVSSLGPVDTQFKVELEESSEDEAEDEGLTMKDAKKTENEEDDLSKTEIKLDIMAQQLKFVACLKILMEELSTLATGYEVDGGKLRYQLYAWLEKSVIALKKICDYQTLSMRSNLGRILNDKMAEDTHHPSSGTDQSAGIMFDFEQPLQGSPSDRFTPRGSRASDNSSFDYRPTLHEVLLADKVAFEQKLERSQRRKRWLQANESLIRNLLSYCSLHGSHGGGLASVKMELILLLQELQQERSQQQLLSPLPFPTTLPLLAASVACQKTVIADPIRHMMLTIHDILQTMMDLSMPPLSLPPNYSLVYILRDLGISLSSCIYQSLCDSDNIGPKQRSVGRESITASNLLSAGSHPSLRRIESGEPVVATTPPNKWPGVQSLRALLARDKDEDSPKLHTLLCEAYVAVYLSQLLYALAACDSHELFRLIGQNFSEKTWAELFGGGAKTLIHVAASSSATSAPIATPSQTGSQEPDSKPETPKMDLITTLAAQRQKLHMKILQQLNQGEKPITPPNMKEDRPTYRETFIPPKMSIIAYLSTKPRLPDEYILLDYDSSESVASEEEGDDNLLDDDFGSTFGEAGMGTGSIFGDADKHRMQENQKMMELEQYAWGIIRCAVVKLAAIHMAKFLTVAGIELQDLPTISPLIHAIFKVMEIWMSSMKSYMDSLEGPPPQFLPNSYVESSRQGGPAILKYKALLELNNTPFRTHNRITKASKRLWNYLVRQEDVQHLFIRFIFGKSKGNATSVMANAGLPTMETSDDLVSTHNGDLGGGSSVHVQDGNPDPIKVVHKDQDNISSFCISKANHNIIAVATHKEIQEMDISALLEDSTWLQDEAEYDILNLLKAPESLPSTDYYMIQHPADKLMTSPGAAALAASSYTISSQQQHGKHPSYLGKLVFPGSDKQEFCQYVVERSRHVFKPLKRHKTEGVRRMASHPSLPLYLSGSQDGAVNLWEWSHKEAISTPRPGGTFAKVTKIGFNNQGNKFGVTDGDGNLSLWQVSLTSAGTKPFFSLQTHSKIASDFTFLGSSSLIVTAGQSTDHRNVALWDTLMPLKKACVSTFACHEQQGASSVLYAPVNQLLITGGKKGDVFIFDMRQRTQRNKFQAHESAVKCMALDPGEEFFVTGSADGDIKVWSLNTVNVLLYSFPQEHARSSLFRNVGMGVSHLYVDFVGRLFSCGADGSMKMRQLPDRVVNSI